MTESLLDQSPAETQIDLNKSFVDQLVGEGKKFRDMEALAKGKYEADLHIKSKNAQFDALSEEYNKVLNESKTSSKLQELIDRLETQRQTPPANTQMQETPPQNTFDPSQIQSLVAQQVQEMDTQRTQQQNWNMVKDKLQSEFGPGFAQMVASKTQELGITAAEVDRLARTSPAAALQLLGVDAKPSAQAFQAPPRSSQRNDTFSPTSNTRKWSHWKGLLKSQPNLFSDPKSHNQMMADIKAIGEANFYDTP